MRILEIREEAPPCLLPSTFSPIRRFAHYIQCLYTHPLTCTMPHCALRAQRAAQGPTSAMQARTHVAFRAPIRRVRLTRRAEVIVKRCMRTWRVQAGDPDSYVAVEEDFTRRGIGRIGVFSQTRAHLPAPIRFESSGSDAAANQGPPTLVWRVLAALCYLVPWIDSISFGREMYRRFRNLLVLYLVPGPLAKVYFSSQFAPLIIFFVLFLAVVKNKKLHHFVRFNCMQAIMLDIVIMLCHIVKAYLPAEIKWSVIAHLVDMGMWTTCMGTVVYAVFWTLRGYYADIPFVSESVYHQVALSEYA